MDAEVVLHIDVEHDHLGIEHHLLLRLASSCETRCFIFDGIDLQNERLARCQTIAVFPHHTFLSVARDFMEGRRHLRTGNFLRLAIDFGGSQFTRCRRLQRGLRAFQYAHRTATHLDHRLRLVFQIRRQSRAHRQSRQFRPRAWQNTHRLAHIAERQRKSRVFLLRRKRQRILVLLQSAHDHRLITDPRLRLRGRPARVLVELHLQIERLRIRHHETVWQLLDFREGEALDITPRRHPARHCVPRGVRHQRERGDREHRRHTGSPAPLEMLRLGHGVREILVLHRLSRLIHRRLHQPFAASC